jgi:hypothetical protein
MVPTSHAASRGDNKTRTLYITARLPIHPILVKVIFAFSASFCSFAGSDIHVIGQIATFACVPCGSTYAMGDVLPEWLLGPKKSGIINSWRNSAS